MCRDVQSLGAKWFAVACILLSGAAMSEARPEDSPSAALPAPKAAENRLLDIAVAGESLIAVGQFGVILRSQDGDTWEQMPSPVDTMLTRVVFTDAQSGWALGYDASILQTQDGGLNWTLRYRDPQARALYELLFIDPQRAIAVGAYGQMLRSEDGGQSWQIVESELTDLGMHFNALVRLGDGSLVVLGERGLMARSKDHGGHWEVLDFPYEGSQFGALAHGEKGLSTFGMRGNVYQARNIDLCPLIDIDAWDPYERVTVDDAQQLADMGWQHAQAEAKESLFGGLSIGPHRALLVGVNGIATVLNTETGKLRPVEADSNETLSKAVLFEGQVIAVGRRGVSKLGPVP